MDLGTRIRQVRERLGLNQQEFAERLRTGQAVISRYERNERIPGADFLLRLHITFGVNMNWLLTGKGYMFMEEAARAEAEVPERISDLSPDVFRKEIGERLKVVRKTLDLSQKEMADRLGIATSTYQYYERGERDVPAYLIYRLAALFEVSPVWLLTGKGRSFLSAERPSPESKPLEAILSFIRKIWEKGDERERIWFEIQFEKCFPEFATWKRILEEKG